MGRFHLRKRHFSAFCKLIQLHIVDGFNLLEFNFVFVQFQLSEPLNLNVPSAKPVVLPPPTSQYDPPVGTVVTVSGWGTTIVRDQLNSHLFYSV